MINKPNLNNQVSLNFEAFSNTLKEKLESVADNINASTVSKDKESTTPVR